MKRNVVVAAMGLCAAMVWGCAEIVGLPEGEWTTVCESGNTRCSPTSNTVQACVGGVWQDKTTCQKSTCDNGVCNGECAPDEKECLEKTVRKCEGGTWVPDEVCPYVCTSGACTGECVSGSKRCSGNTPQTCDANSLLWQDASPCTTTAPRCEAGTCVLPPSCVGLSYTCGPKADESCCAMGAVPGGTYNRSNDAAAPATVSDFQLDRFEITVGRFRKFVEAYPGNIPMPGAGAHPLIPQSGWDAAWNAKLPTDQAALKAAVKCNSTYQTWTDATGANENLPMNCLSWYESFAFCAWDGGRLPTEAEWNYAAAGGAEQRVYPWSNPASSMTIDGTYAVYNCQGDGSPVGNCSFQDILTGGSRSPKGDGLWGHADLGGSMWEWNLDGFDSYIAKCSNCANTLSISCRVIRGGYWNNNASGLLSSLRNCDAPDDLNFNVGARCARTP